MKHLILLLLAVVCNVSAFADAPLRRPISVNQPAWFVHIDNWNDADPQKIIDLIPEDIKPYVVFNISMSISHNETTGEFDRVPDGYSTARSWLRTCAENNVWAMVQCSSGGFSHFSETDLRFYEELYRDYPNFIGWNYAEQFWGFDDKFSCSFDERLSHFADLMKLARKYGGYTCISFCGNIWSLPLSPLAMMKRSAAFAEQAAAAPQNLIICDKYTMSSMFYEYESMSFGSFIAGYTTNFGIRFDQCGWNAELESEKDNMPAAAGAAPVLNNWLINGGTVNDGPELIWQQDFKTEGKKALANGFYGRSFSRFPQFDNVSIDLYRKILDGTIRIPTREEVIERNKLVLINDVNTGDNEVVYGAPRTLYDGLYNMKDGEFHHEQKNWFKKTGRYPTIPVVPTLVDDLAQSINTQVLRSEYDKRWSTIAKKKAEFNSLFPEEYTGNAFAGRVGNRWLIYNPLKSGASAKALIPLQYNTCKDITLIMSQYTTCLMKEKTDGISLYLTNYRTDVTALKNDTIVITGATAQPAYTWKDRSTHSASNIVKEQWDNGVFTLIIAHNGPLDVDIQCAGGETGRKEPVADHVLVVPEKPAAYDGPLTHECEDFDFKNTNEYKLAPYALNSMKGFHALGYHDMGTQSAAMIRDTFNVSKAGKYDVTIRYSAPNGSTQMRIYVGGQFKQIALAKTAKNEWRELTVKGMAFAEGKNQLAIRNYNTTSNVYLDQVTVTSQDYKPAKAFNVDRMSLAYNTYVNETGTDSLYLNAQSLTGAVSIVANGDFAISTSRDGSYSTSLTVEGDENGNISDRIIYVRMNAMEATGTYTGSVTFSAEGCMDHVTELTGAVSPHPVTIIYDFTDDKAGSYATTPPAKDVTKPTYGQVTAGVVSYKGSNMLKIYTTSGRHSSGALDLNKFTSKATDYSVTWKQYYGASSSYKVGMMLRAGKVVGNSTAGYAQGFRSGYLFIANNDPSGGNTTFRIYKSTESTNLNSLVTQSAALQTSQGTPVWYRVSVNGYPIVNLTFEYSTDGENWTIGAQTVDASGSFQSGSTQIAWGLDATASNFFLDDITFDGVTFDPTAVKGVMSEAGNDGGTADIYNLQGQKVREMKDGNIYITNGKKILK